MTFPRFSHQSCMVADRDGEYVLLEHHNDCIKTLEAQLEQQPIETAPQDGTVILIFRNRKDVESVHAARWAYQIDPEYPWQVLCEEYGTNALPDDSYITHWMPLPTPLVKE